MIQWLGPLITGFALAAVTADTASPAPFVEKAPLERYVPPAKPSLVGLSRAALADALGAIGVPQPQRKMRVQQIWHWLYVRGATSLDQMTNVSRGLHTLLDQHFTLARPEVVAEQIRSEERRVGKGWR